VEERSSGTTSRRRFLGTAAGATGVALAAAAWKPAQAAAAIPDQGPRVASPIQGRSFVSGHFGLEIEGAQAGFLKSVDGGGATADVVTEAPAGQDRFSRKHLGNVKYEEFSMQIGFNMNKAVYDWIAASWTSSFMRKSGAVVAADFKSDIKSKREFSDALITETGIPACDGSSKEAGYLRLNFAPEVTTDVKASGTLSVSKQQKLWLTSNFKLEIDGLDCTRVNKIDAFTVKQALVTSEIGDDRDYEREPGKVEFPNLSITFAEVSAHSWVDWHKSFLIQGNNGQEQEKNGRLLFVSANLQEQLLEIKFFNLGIFKLDAEAGEPNADAPARMTAELYCERMEFTYMPSVVT
jgi:hypothetical protein